MADSDVIRAYDISSVPGEVLTIAIRKEFDFGNLHQDWAQSIATQHPGPFRQIRIDLSQCGLVSSTFFAGVVQLHHSFNPDGTKPIVLVRPDPRLVRNLAMLRLDKLFIIEGR
jgi:anti-anti-sigma regulatory factor